MITYADFKKKYPVGSSVASPEGLYKGECVSYVRQYMQQVNGFLSGPLGNAVDIPSNPAFLAFYRKVTTPRVGDLMFWGDDVGSWTGPNGHTAIYDGNSVMMNQNYNGSGVVSRNQVFTQGFIGYYRPKGEDMVTKTQITDLARAILGRQAVDADLELVGKVTYDAARKKFYESEAYKLRVQRAKEGRLDATTYLPDSVRAAYVDPVYTEVTEKFYRKGQ